MHNNLQAFWTGEISITILFIFPYNLSSCLYLELLTLARFEAQKIGNGSKLDPNLQGKCDSILKYKVFIKYPSCLIVTLKSELSGGQTIQFEFLTPICLRDERLIPI